MRIFTSCGSGVIALAITPPNVFGNLLNFTRFQIEDGDLGSVRFAQQVNTLIPVDG